MILFLAIERPSPKKYEEKYGKCSSSQSLEGKGEV
jgi:hypothetical protein